MILAIETSCDEIAAAIVDKNFVVHKNIIFSSAELAKKTGGVVPEISARDAAKKIATVLEKTCENIDWEKIDAIAVTNGPGLVGSLLTGIEAAKTLAFLKKKPLIPVYHIFGHMCANFLSEVKHSSTAEIPDICRYALANSGMTEGGEKNFRITSNKRRPSIQNFPKLVLTVSGGHNDIYLWKSEIEYQKLARTIDDAAGECFDKCARMLGFAYPGGPEISKWAEKGNPKAYDFPRPMMQKDKPDFSFSGLKTSLFYKLRDLQKDEFFLSDAVKSDLAASIQEAICDTLIIKFFRQVENFFIQEVHLTGGVSANMRLREKFLSEAKKRNIQAFFPEKIIFSTDNAAMIGAAAQLIWKNSDDKIFPFDRVEARF